MLCFRSRSLLSGHVTWSHEVMQSVVDQKVLRKFIPYSAATNINMLSTERSESKCVNCVSRKYTRTTRTICCALLMEYLPNKYHGWVPFIAPNIENTAFRLRLSWIPRKKIIIVVMRECVIYSNLKVHSDASARTHINDQTYSRIFTRIFSAKMAIRKYFY